MHLRLRRWLGELCRRLWRWLCRCRWPRWWPCRRPSGEPLMIRPEPYEIITTPIHHERLLASSVPVAAELVSDFLPDCLVIFGAAPAEPAGYATARVGHLAVAMRRMPVLATLAAPPGELLVTFTTLAGLRGVAVHLTSDSFARPAAASRALALRLAIRTSPDFLVGEFGFAMDAPEASLLAHHGYWAPYGAEPGRTAHVFLRAREAESKHCTNRLLPGGHAQLQVLPKLKPVLEGYSLVVFREGLPL